MAWRQRGVKINQHGMAAATRVAASHARRKQHNRMLSGMAAICGA